MIDSCHHFKNKILEKPIRNVLGSGRIIKTCSTIEQGFSCPFPARYCPIKNIQDSELILKFLALRNETGFNKLSDFEMVDPILWDKTGSIISQKVRK